MNMHELAKVTEKLDGNTVLQVTKRNKSYNVYPLEDMFKDTKFEHTIGMVSNRMDYKELQAWLHTMESLQKRK